MESKNTMKNVTLEEGESLNIVNENLDALKIIFPEAFTEGFVNFDTLRQLLGDEVDEGDEKYGLNWHGKKKARQISLTPSTGTLRPCPEESTNWDTTQNLFIEGDNLEVLKLLQKSYAGKIKMIYIDPPYNTGKEFIYPDHFQDNLETYLRYTGQKDNEGFKMSSNVESSGRFHTTWLNMLYPRLKLARNLLKSNGVVFISIDDNEVGNLRSISDEIFGSDNFVGVFVINSTPNARDYGHIGKMHEYALMYVRDAIEAKTYQIPEQNKKFKYSDANGDFNIHPLYNSNVAFNKGNRPNLFYPFYIDPDSIVDDYFLSICLEKSENSIEVYPPLSQKEGVQFVWRWGKEKAKDGLDKEIVGYKMGNGEFRIVQKMRHSSKIIRSLLSDKMYSTRRGTAEVEKLFGKKIFSFPKPRALLDKFLVAGSTDGDVVLDLFAGSCSTADALFHRNASDGHNRQFIMVQLPESTEEYPEASKAGFKSIADIGKERMRLAAKKVKKEFPDCDSDFGFKVFKLDSSNIRAWNPESDDLEKTLLDHTEHLVEGRSEEDVLYELLLKRGVNLTVPIEQKEIGGKSVYSIGFGVLFACLNVTINLDEVESLAKGILDWHKELKPASDTQIVFRDSAFADDIAKTNMTAILEQNGITHVRSL